MEPDFGGYATRAGLKCSDGLTIMPDAFKHNDGQKVPMVWQHNHNDPGKVIGHAVLENRPDGVYAHGYFNNTEAGATSKALVQNRDVESLSIYANQLTKNKNNVIHGNIREVSLVLAGANPGAFIDFINIVHGDGSFDVSEEEAVIYTGLPVEIEHSKEDKMPEIVHEEAAPASSEKTVKDVFDSMTEEQKNAVYYMVGQALESDDDDVEQDALDDEEEILQHDHEGAPMSRNVFDQTNSTPDKPVLSHAQLKAIQEDAQRCGSYKEAFLAHADEYGITNIDLLFPDARNVQNTPEWIKRRTEWVSTVINGTHHSPFSRVKSMHADITHEEARAKGYIKGNVKKDEFFGLSKRVTTPTTIYKKQKLDRDDIIDVTDLDVVAWLKAEMRVMLDEELARAILIGDGREVEDDDKVRDPASMSDGAGIRSIANDDPFYAHQVQVPANVTGEALIENILRNRKHYKGTGNPTFFTTEDVLTDLILLKDKMGRRLYPTQAELESALRVSRIIPVEVMEDVPDLLGIMVNLSDYTLGTDRGGNISMFDDFDIDYNQYKYLLETRLSGTLTKYKTAIVIRRTSGTSVTPTPPTQNGNDLTIPSVTGVVYSIDGEPVTGTVTITEDTWVEADPDVDYYFPANITREWAFEFQQ